ncbi:hypothetical protein NQ317_017624 [Molorchus minor]|uniref:DNA-directed DNA polymerase n=1 Tax=Molorchus minor TaxID=1323400 RepID=A0ABQ9IR29_9CUCU|nr:hypothetical protein NQ317_017624 [Molorchus minor]
MEAALQQILNGLGLPTNRMLLFGPGPPPEGAGPNNIPRGGGGPGTKQVFEFHGCYYHGCPTCFTENRDKPTYDNTSETMETRYQNTIAKTERLRNAGFSVIEKWECVFRREMDTNTDIKQYVENHPLLVNLPINPRDAFYGGRTDATKLYYEVKPGEKIKYIDVCSLYPYICKTAKFPVGHPDVFVGDECKNLNLNETDGLIKCKILPPTNLYHALLPVKMNDKLMFVLCRTCGEITSNTECQHDDESRALTSTWVIDEILEAIRLGYRILQIFEIWKYDVEVYNVDTKTGGLFTGYINKFLKTKLQASGWPENCNTLEEKHQYIADCNDQMGVQLNFDEIEKNPALRQVGKDVITSFWGRMGLRENQSKTTVINSNPALFFQMMTDPAIFINNILPINDKTLIVNWEFRDESYEILPTVNVCLAAYTTTLARLKLYSYLEKLGNRVLYHDTDSVVYISQEDDNIDIPLGSMLGEMTNELECYGPNSYITKFVSGGPKLYAYVVHSPSNNEYTEVCKVKGICINHTVSKDVNFNKMRDMILQNDPPLCL